MIIEKYSFVSDRVNSMEVDLTQQEYDKFIATRSTVLIQDALPNLNKIQREFLVSGMTEKEQNLIFNNN